MTYDEDGSNGALTATPVTKVQRFTGEILLNTRPKTYRRVVDLLAHGESAHYIAQTCKVSENTVAAIRLRQASTIEARKNELSLMVSDIAHIGAARVADKIGKAAVRDAIIGTGVAIDKFLALNGQGANQVNVAVVLPTAEERAIQDQRFARLEAITARLALPDKPA